MKWKIILAAGSIGGLALMFATAPNLISYSQKKDDKQEKRKSDDDGAFRHEVAKSVIGSMFLENISMKQTAWRLEKSHHFPRHESKPSARISMRFSDGDKSVSFSIIEADSSKDADSHFGGLPSYGTTVPYNRYGEKGQITIHDNGDFMALRFRQGRYHVQIFAVEQENAEFFAGLILETLRSATK